MSMEIPETPRIHTGSVNSILEQLVGLPFTGVGRAADLIWCAFGRDIDWRDFRGNLTKKSEFALHFQCPFRITLGERLLVGSADIHEYPHGEQAGHPSPSHGEPLFDSRIDELADGNMLSSVMRANVQVSGDIRIDLKSNVALEAFIDTSARVESWRFIKLAEPRFHFVFPDDCEG